MNNYQMLLRDHARLVRALRKIDGLACDIGLAPAVALAKINQVARKAMGGKPAQQQTGGKS